MIIKVGLFIVISLVTGVFHVWWPMGQLQVIFCDVGQGDATLVQYGNLQVLVDGGPDAKVLNCLGEHMPYFDRTIELVLASHQDSDHIGGLNSVFANYRVKQLVWNGEAKETADFLAFNQAIQREKVEGMTTFVPVHGQRVKIGTDLVLNYLFPRVAPLPEINQTSPDCETHLQDISLLQSKQEYGSNNGSIVLFIEYKQVNILLMGDLEASGELTLNCLDLLDPTSIVKVGHHGSKSSSSQVFVDKTQPEFAILSVGKNNRYGHPVPEVMSRYDAVGSIILRTDLLGSIVLLSDGARVWRKIPLFGS